MCINALESIGSSVAIELAYVYSDFSSLFSSLDVEEISQHSYYSVYEW